MENMEKIYLLNILYILIKPDNFGLVKFFQKCTVWEIASLAKNSSLEKGVKKDKVVISILLQFFTGASD
jgi:hypothetical protein